MPLNIVAFVLRSLGFMQSVEALICAAGLANSCRVILFVVEDGVGSP